jgi:putative membrane protein
MGAADAVPGVSGGTIALVVGVYERLVDGLDTLVRSPSRLRTREGRARLGAALRFLLPLGVGIALSYFVGTRVLVGPRDAPGLLRRASTAPLCYAFFLGLVVFSLGEPWRRIRRRSALGGVVAVAACAATAWAVGLDYARGRPEDWMLLYGGALAVSVMLLPGISGSLMLVVIGQYTTVAGALHDGRFARLGIFLVGVAVGLALFVPVLRALLRRRHDLTMAALTGLMAGSVRALWPWKSHYDLKDGSQGRMLNVGVGHDVGWVLCALAAGALSVWLLRRLERRIEARG